MKTVSLPKIQQLEHPHSADEGDYQFSSLFIFISLN